MKQTEWLQENLGYLRGLRNPTEQQKLLLMLVDKEDRDDKDNRKLTVLIRAEKASERAQTARAAAARIINSDKATARKARDHEMYRAAGLMVLAGLVDKKTGEPTRDRGELLGALLMLAEAQPNDERRLVWKQRGDKVLAEKM